MNSVDTQERLQALVKELPPEFHEDVISYIESLLPEKKPKHKYLGQGWAGALKGHYDGYTSVELQKEILNMWDEMAMKGVSGYPRKGRCIWLIPTYGWSAC